MTTPISKRYDHSCEKCIFLGQWKEYDLYYCENCCLGGATVIARWGGDKADYVSGLDEATQSVTPHLQEAKRRAEQLGLIKVDASAETTAA